MSNRDQIWVGRQVIIPKIVVHHLEVPAELAGGGLQADEAVSVEVLTLAVCTVEIKGGGAKRQVDEPALLVHGHDGPNVDAGPILPGVAFPRFVTRLARSGNRMEGPDQPASAHVEGANIAAGTEARRLRHGRTHDDEAAIDSGR